MISSFILGAYWTARREEIDLCTARAHRFFAGLTKIDPLLADWYQLGRSRKDALRKKVDPTDPGTLRELLLKGRNRRDIGREVIEELGFRISLWNGAKEDEAAAKVSILCGCYSERVVNCVVIDLPEQIQPPSWTDHAASLLALVAETWQPRWAGLISDQARRERDFGAREPFVDWMVYVPHSVDAVPPPGRVEVLPGLGSIVIVQPEPTTGNDPEELSRIRKVEGIIGTL